MTDQTKKRVYEYPKAPVQLGVRVRPETRDILMKQARADDRSVASYVRRLLEKHTGTTFLNGDGSEHGGRLH